ncbi:MAG: hypothetical protein UU77_C0006G0017 [candidate division WWE3 bacterium GW2011_GWC1_41_7]|uniref:YtxH domain-containing protein n=2 Tax=Katanobacteria TaxID=422282 RepID=A0A0G0XCE3_UNCKA|nr:MAG: hypothetical protein UU77_C0006G0017 [candidate division WWE3 bacterium GW2011_GWC1_41_7]KKS22072.1 MAG: hypothetical protein UU80_C0014G0027 [candidate division WWE3 bacterium GW2011_GWA1_41_8]
MNNNNNANKSLLSALFGAAIGAAAVYLSDRKNREKVKTKWEELKDQGSEKIEEIKDKVDKTKNKAEEELDEMKRGIAR